MTATSNPTTFTAPRLAEGVELMGELEDSGFEETPYLARRGDGTVLQLPEILYCVAAHIDGAASYEQIAAGVTQALGAELDPDDARFLVDEKLAPLGLIAGPAAQAAAEQRAEEQAAEPKPANDLLALTWKAKVISEGLSRRITTFFQPLFFGPVVLVLVLGFFALGAWLFCVHGISQPVRQILYNPALLVMVFAGVVVATAFHEIGHATGCRYSGAKPGAMGVGIYVIWPVFYTDVTSAYGLDRRGRLRTDLGGIYFNAIFALVVAGVFALTHWEPILILVMVQTFAIVQQLLPLGRLDGYLILTDLTGIPDLLGRMKPVLRSAVPGNDTEPEVRELKPWVRRIVTGYILLLVPVLALIVVMMIMHAPRVFSTAYDSLAVRVQKVDHAFSQGHTATGVGDIFQCLALVLPALGMVVSSGRIGKRVGSGALSWSAGRPFRRAIVVAGTVASVGLAAYTWWPNGDYRPIQPGERGTLQGGIHELSAVSGGRPSLTPARQQQLNGAPSVRAHQSSSTDNQTKDKSPANQETTPTTTAPTLTTETDTTTTDTSTTPTTTAPTTTTDTSSATTPTTTDTTPTTTDTSTSTTPTTTTDTTTTTTTP